MAFSERKMVYCSYSELTRGRKFPMTTITITLPDERVSTLKERANRLGVTPEELVQVSIGELLARPADDFQRAVDYVLKKNADLYKRLP
jgi:hypothetical protein